MKLCFIGLLAGGVILNKTSIPVFENHNHLLCSLVFLLESICICGALLSLF